jgi:hypothetical protein
MEPEVSAPREDRSRLPVAFAAGAVVVLLMLGGLLVVTRSIKSHEPAAGASMPFGATEQAYAARIHFTDIQLAKATNMLNQEFTYVAGVISNDGVRNIRGLDVTLEFWDPFNQIVLRDTEHLIPTSGQPLAGGARRDFQITFEHVPSEWNQQHPAIQVIGLILE